MGQYHLDTFRVEANRGFRALELGKPSSPRSPTNAGFALISLVTLVPLLVTLITCVSGLYSITRNKLSAQAACTQTAILLQRELREDLVALLGLNPQADRLRRRREKAQSRLQMAVQSGNPLLIQIATAELAAVTAEQLALRARQERILQEAAQRRRTAHLRLRGTLRGTRHGPIRAEATFPLPLAVAARPPAALTPRYDPVPGFEQAQQHRFRFHIELAPSYLRESFAQDTACSASLQKEGEKWRETLVAVNP